MDPEVFWLASRPLAKPSPVPPKVQTYSSRYLSSTNGDLLSIVVCGNVTRPEGRGSSRVACGHNSYPARGARDFCRRALGIAAQPSSCRGSSRLGYCGADITLQLGRRSLRLPMGSTRVSARGGASFREQATRAAGFGYPRPPSDLT